MQIEQLYSGAWSSKWARLALALFGLFLAVLYDVVFWKKELGFGLLLFVVVYIIGFFTFLFLTNSLRQKKFLWLLVPLLILSADVFFYNNHVVQKIVPLVIFGIAVLISILVTVNNDDRHPFYLFSIPIISKLFHPVITKIQFLLGDLSNRATEGKSEVYKKILIGLFTALPLIIIFGALFISADHNFADWLANIPEKLDASYVWRVFRTLILTLLIAGFFYELVGQGHRHQLRNLIVEKFDNVVVTTLLVVLNALFALFVVFQFEYLFGTYNYVIENNLVFSTYAKEGFGELIAATCLTLLILIVVFRSFSHHGASKGITTFSSLLMLQTAVIAASAWRRLDLYQQAYGLTTQRLYSIWFVYFLIALLLMSVIFLFARWKFKNFIHATLTLSLLAFTLVASLNVDYTIAKENLKRFQSDDKRWDIEYIVDNLSVDALPALEEYASVNPKFDDALANMKGADISLDLKSALNRKGEYIANHDEFVEFNWGVFKAKGAFEKLKPTFDKLNATLEKQAQDEALQDKIQNDYFNISNKISSRQEQAMGCYARGLSPTTYDCVDYRLNDKPLVVAVAKTGAVVLYQWVRTAKNYELERANLETPSMSSADEVFLLRNGFIVAKNLRNFYIKIYKVVELNNKYSLAETEI